MGVTLVHATIIAVGVQLMVIILVAGQNELYSNPSQIPKTHFRCKGRSQGYYADIETGCQVYHMCDGLGRQFSYTCPNTTLFQQRMLICDHWYMVNCSKAESDYSANLLIGQRDKPFVSDDEHDVRTPRPDLFERPYAPEFGGSEALRKTISPLLNSIQNYDKRPVHHKSASSPVNIGNRNDKPFVVPGRWSTVHPLQTSPTPPPPPTPAPTQHVTFQPNYNQYNQFESSQPPFSGGSDLKTSSSQDSRRTQNENVFETDDKPSSKKTTPKPLIIEFQPPFEHPIFNQNNPPAETTKTPQLSTQFSRPLPTTVVPEFIQTTVNAIQVTHQPPTYQPGTQPPQSHDESLRLARPSSSASSGVVNFGDRLKQPSVTPTAPTPPPLQSGNLVPVLTDGNKFKEPPTVLLPPYEDANLPSPTTQGPPVYHEWKLPSSDLEPPFDEFKSNGVITINSDENQIPVIPPQTTQPTAGASFLDKDLVPPLFEPSSTNVDNVQMPSLSLQPPAYSPIPVYNDTVESASNHSFPSFSALQNTQFTQSTDKSQTQRSVPTTPTLNAISTKRQSETTTRKDLNYLELKKQFLIPEYTFPLENIERPSYTESNAVNSFQIKIPDDVAQSQELISEGSSNEVQRRPWYGENAKCPECHPSFLKPGSCEPCIKIH